MTNEQIIVWNLIDRYIDRYDFSVVDLKLDDNWCHVVIKRLESPPQDVRRIVFSPHLIHEIASQNQLTIGVMNSVDEAIKGRSGI
jgi:hypothetical protein